MSGPNSILRRFLLHALASNPSQSALDDLLPAEQLAGAPIVLHVSRASLVAQLALNRGRGGDAVAPAPDVPILMQARAEYAKLGSS